MGFAPLFNPRFQRNALIEGDPIVRRTDMMKTRRDIEASIQQTVMSRIFGITPRVENGNIVDANAEKPLYNRIAQKIVAVPLNVDVSAALCGDGLDLLPQDSSFTFHDGSPVVQGNILCMDLAEDVLRFRWQEKDKLGHQVAWEAEVHLGFNTQRGKVKAVSINYRVWGNLHFDFWKCDNWVPAGFGYAVDSPLLVELWSLKNWIFKTPDMLDPYPGWELNWLDRNPDGSWATAATGTPACSANAVVDAAVLSDIFRFSDPGDGYTETSIYISKNTKCSAGPFSLLAAFLAVQ